MGCYRDLLVGGLGEELHHGDLDRGDLGVAHERPTLVQRRRELAGFGIGLVASDTRTASSITGRVGFRDTDRVSSVLHLKYVKEKNVRTHLLGLKEALCFA